jgi:hypothetical protein
MDGVVVLGVDAPEAAPEDNCFVGDLVGDYSILVSGMVKQADKGNKPSVCFPACPISLPDLG